MPSEVPAGWQQTRLGAVALGKPEYGANVAKGAYNPAWPRYLRVTDLDGGGGLNPEVVSISPADARPYMLHAGDLLLARSGATVGKSFLYETQDGECAFAGYLIRFRLDSNRVEPSFVAQYLHSDAYWRWVSVMARAGAQPNINAKEYGRLPVLLPPLPEQKKIAAILSSVDEAIQATQAVIEQTRRVKEGLLQDLLTRGIGHTRFKQTAIGEIPESWAVQKLEEVANYENGKAHERDVVEDGPFILINAKFLSTGGRTWKTVNVRHTPARTNDVVMVLSDLPNGRALARTFLIPDDHNYAVNQRICRITANGCRPDFLRYWLDRNPYFLAFDTGVTQTHLRKQAVLDCPVPVPTPSEQEQIVDRLQSVDEQIVISEGELTALQKTKAGLLQDLLTGKVRVSV